MKRIIRFVSALKALMHRKNYQVKYGKCCVKNASHLPDVSPLFRDAITIARIFFAECFTTFRLYLRALRAGFMENLQQRASRSSNI